MTEVPLRWLGIDGDDTLWHSEVGFQAAEAAYVEVLSDYVDAALISPALLEVEIANLTVYGYGVKAMTLSMLENATAMTSGRISAGDVDRILEIGRWLLDHPVELLDGVAETLPVLAETYRLLLITKGDLLHQEHKVQRSGLTGHFVSIEIVSEKDPGKYRGVLDQHDIDPAQFAMVGNSLRSDIAPVLEIGARAVHIPHGVTWAAEQLSEEATESISAQAPTLGSFAELPETLRHWA